VYTGNYKVIRSSCWIFLIPAEMPSDAFLGILASIIDKVDLMIIIESSSNHHWIIIGL